ncbi:unnamed protein product, partial [Rotaria socialis]
LMLKRSFRLI